MKKILLCLIAIFVIGSGVALSTQPPVATSFTSSGASVQIAVAPAQSGGSPPLSNYHTIQIQAAVANTQTVFVCLNTQNQCTAAKSFLELAPGGMYGPVTVGMYTGMSGQQLAGSGLFTSDISFISASGTQSVHALVD